MYVGVSTSIEVKDGDVDKLEMNIIAMFEEGMDKLAEEMEWVWRQKAAATLKTSKDEYLKNLTVTNDKESITFSLEGFLPTAVETGTEGFDLKPGFLKVPGFKR